MADTSMVKLASGDLVREFAIEHAEGLLNMNLRGGTGWHLADEGYELVDGRLTKKAAKKDNKKDKE